jgi:DNA-binding response OmpR family regulator
VAALDEAGRPLCGAPSARGDWTEKVEGIEAGADDYMAKPFEMGELVARVRALVRRGAGRVSSVVAIGGLRLDTMRMSAVFNGAPARLSPLEFRLLDYLSHQSGRAVSAGELAEHLYGAAEDGDTNAIEAIVARLRRKFGAGIIVTRRGFGYLLEPSA